MKKAGWICVLVFAALLLFACTAKESSDTAITAVILEGEHYFTEVSAVTTEPGNSVSFYIETDPGYTVTETDYRGEYYLTQTRGLTKLELKNVRYPTKVRLTLSHYTRTIRYLANGGEALTDAGTDLMKTYDVRVHIRPNVSIGTDLFARDGYTLTGWNTAADGSGERVGLGSRMTVDNQATLYAQWAKWTPEELFFYRLEEDGSAVITGYIGSDATLVIPETVDGHMVTCIDAKAFANCSAETVILPKSIVRIEKKAFAGAQLSALMFYDNVEYITDECFDGCRNLSTLYINAIEDPYGYSYRRESVFVDKMDMLITTMGEDRLLFYGGCSVWYNLIGTDVVSAFDGEYTVLNMAINGITSSLFQMELIQHFVTDRDILIHSPEISSVQQLLTNTELINHDAKLWCAMEYNYDLVSLLDIRVFDGGVFESLRLYYDKKKPGGKYTDDYRDSKGYAFLDETGSVPFWRDKSAESLADYVSLDPSYLEDLSRLEQEYRLFTEQGVRIYVTFTCVNIDQVPEDERQNVSMMGALFLSKFREMDCVTVYGDIHEFIYHDGDCYDTVYHLLSTPAKRCTSIWIRDLKAQMTADGLWEEGK